jgi:hypothetical protein
VLSNLTLERADLMLRHAVDSGNAAVAQPELRFLPTFPGVHMGSLAPISTIKQENPALPPQDRWHAMVFPLSTWVSSEPQSRITLRSTNRGVGAPRPSRPRLGRDGDHMAVLRREPGRSRATLTAALAGAKVRD